MRQVNIKTLQAKLSQEILDLPFEITKKGKVVAIMVQKEAATSERGIYLKKETAKKLTEIIKKKQSTDNSEAHSSTGAGHFNPCPKPGKK